MDTRKKRRGTERKRYREKAGDREKKTRMKSKLLKIKTENLSVKIFNSFET
jgi:hypothetical protein